MARGILCIALLACARTPAREPVEPAGEDQKSRDQDFHPLGVVPTDDAERQRMIDVDLTRRATQQAAADAVAPRAGHFFVGGCNTGCTGCSLADRRTYIVGTLTKSGQQIFPDPPPSAGGAFSCAAQVAVGTHVTLVAQSTSGLELEIWKTSGPGDLCPCEGTNAPTCAFVVTTEMAAQYTRIYCGAIWRRPGARLAH